MRVVIWMTLKCRPDKSVKVSLPTCVSPKIILCHTMELNERVSEAYNADSGHLELNQQNYAIAVSYIFEYLSSQFHTAGITNFYFIYFSSISWTTKN